MANPPASSPHANGAPVARVRLDKWLWAARFYKTRSQAGEGIDAGHVRARGERLKAAHAVVVGETITIHKEGVDWEVEVLAVSDKRGSGADAARLYRETDAGREKRLAQIEARKAAAQAFPSLRGRPTKRLRRVLDRFRGA
jgi:ribosome-associated heat shock protein Hsp15